MRFRIKNSLIFTITLIFIISFANNQAIADIQKIKSDNKNFISNDLLSPIIVISKDNLQEGFSSLFAQIKNNPLKFDEVSLSEIFGNGTIESIFDVATGNGSWMRNCLKQPWAAYKSTVIGFELKEPDIYTQDMRSIVNRAKDWAGLNIVHSKQDPDYPSESSLDLIHEAFMDATRWENHDPRLELYNRLLKQGGWLLLAHVSHKYYIQPEKFTDWLEKNNYLFQVLKTNQDNIPDDYPRTYWWDYFNEEFSLGRSSHPNYLIIAQKIDMKPKPRQINESVLFEQSI